MDVVFIHFSCVSIYAPNHQESGDGGLNGMDAVVILARLQLNYHRQCVCVSHNVKFGRLNTFWKVFLDKWREVQWITLDGGGDRKKKRKG